MTFRRLYKVRGPDPARPPRRPRGGSFHTQGRQGDAMDRREALRNLGASLGGIVLTSACSSEGPVSPSAIAIPNGLRYTVLKRTSNPLPGTGSVSRFRLDCTLDDTADLLYGVIDQAGRPCLYAMTLDYADPTRPAPTQERLVVREGDTLPDGRVVLDLHSYDVNSHGGCAIVLRVTTGQLLPDGEDQGTEMVYFGRQESALRPVLREGLVTPEGHIFSGRFGDIDTHTGHDILVVAQYLHHHEADGHIADNDAPDTRPLEGIFVLPGGDPGGARLVMNTEDLVAGGDVIGGFGLVDLHDGGNFVAQAQPSRVHDNGNSFRADDPADLGGSRIIQSNIRAPRAAALSSFRASTTSSLFNQQVGAAIYGPRLGPDNRAAFVLHHTDHAMSLLWHGHTVASTSAQSPAGHRIINILPPVFGPQGEIYFVAVTTMGHELYVSDGVRTRLMLASGQRFPGDARRVDVIALGTTTEHVDAEGRLALVASFDDGSAALVVGVPV